MLARYRERAAGSGCGVADAGTDLIEARALYARHGYQEIPAYNDDPLADHSFEKRL